MSPTASARRAPAALAAFAALILAMILALMASPAHALARADADDDYGLSTGIQVDIKITVRSDDTYEVIYKVTDKSETPWITESDCSADSFGEDAQDDAKAEYSETDGHRTCVVSGSEDISASDGMITHAGDEYVVDTGEASGYGEDGVSYSVTFPGKVTEADGGTVDGNTVTFDSYGGHTVRGKDSSGMGSLLWILLLIALLVVVAVVVLVVVLSKRKKNKQVPGAPYGPGGMPQAGYPGQQPQGYAPPQAGSPQPSTPSPYQAQPGYPQPGQQPGTPQQPGMPPQSPQNPTGY